MIKIDSFDIIHGSYKGTDVIGGTLDKAIITQLMNWYDTNVEFIEYDGTAIQVAFLNFVKYYLNPVMEWKHVSNTFKVTDNPKNIPYPRRTKRGGDRPTSHSNKK